MSSRTRVVTSTACPVNVTRPVVTVSCPPTIPATTLPATTALLPTPTVPTAIPTTIPTTIPTAAGVTTDALTALAQQLGLGGLGGLGGLAAGLGAVIPPVGGGAPQQVFNNPIAQLAPLNPIASLAATNPSAALAALSPVLGIFNPALNPNAAFLQFNPAAAPTLALSGKGKGKGFGKPFFGKPFGI